jgi:sulfoxide reductase heme-binding subunit YedZ
VSLLTCALVAVHVGTTLLDGYAPIRLADVVLPFASVYRPLWLGLGALGLDLLAALVITSLLRARIGLRGWRAIHWLAYACWPVALLHGLGTGSDVRPGWLTWLALVCAGAVASAVIVRLADQNTSARARVLASGGLAAAALALLVWLPSGPMAAGWAARAGTPKSLLKGTNR